MYTFQEPKSWKTFKKIGNSFQNGTLHVQLQPWKQMYSFNGFWKQPISKEIKIIIEYTILRYLRKAILKIFDGVYFYFEIIKTVSQPSALKAKGFAPLKKS